ncbi:hypothetical protein ElyMa_001875700 [Elysia marginata]|uniref:Uncharacterized protein n=1 Tax=Elysia marginata TaxID=1093978 RepID=A0AAV4EPD6_9GAST|nr:hypothetical protein ElyMa_001875700 [Elysia marginata]
MNHEASAPVQVDELSLSTHPMDDGGDDDHHHHHHRRHHHHHHHRRHHHHQLIQSDVLETLKKGNKSALNRKLTAAKTNKITCTNTYATNLRENAPNVERMKLGVMGGFLHMMSTNKAPNHCLCPKGPTSWCKYNRALANNEEPPDHNPTFSPDIGKYVFPIIKRLTHTDSELLRRCAKIDHAKSQ